MVPTKTGPLYQAGLAVVALAMVLLPAIYIALIVLAVWGVYYHLVHNLWIFAGSPGTGGGGGALIRLILYLGPAVAGGILIFFMVKPFFARQPKQVEPVTLDPAKEPLLFAFVQKICALVRAPVPSRIDVDCQVNASASLRRGLWSRDLVLTIGLPLASGLDMREFGGVLAHEFGHFAQGAGMRLTYVIRKVSFWFARVVYERDAWDVRLEESARGADLRIGIVLHAARGCVWLTRRILWALMHTGNAISCFMLRQMEYDADSYEAKLAGSDAFESTAARLQVLNVATQIAYDDVRQSWTSHRLPENLPLLIDHKAASLPAEVHEKLSAASAFSKTGWFDTHPCDSDRVRAARRLNEPGVFRLTAPATGLFADFSELSKVVTRHQYEKQFELEFTEKNLMPAEEILRESTASAEADAMVKKYFGGVNISLMALLTHGDLPPLLDVEASREQWRNARTASDSLRAEAEKSSALWVEQQGKQVGFNTAHHLLEADFKLEAGAFGLPPNATSITEQRSAAGAALSEVSQTVAEQITKLEPFIAALQERITLALQLALADACTAAERATEIRTLSRLLAALGAEMPKVHETARRLGPFIVLAQNRNNHAKPHEVDQHVTRLITELAGFTGAVRQGLQPFAYPFPHARGALDVADYLRDEKPPENEWERAYREANVQVDRFFPLHYRVLGRVLALADAAEKNQNTV